MEYSKYSIHKAIVYFEEINKYKIRPILLLEGDNKYKIFNILKITSENKNYKYDYTILKWKEAGLKKPSYIKIANEICIEKDLIKEKVGDLQKEDINGMNKLKEIMIKDKENAIKKYNSFIKNKIEIPQNIFNTLNNKSKNKEIK